MSAADGVNTTDKLRNNRIIAPLWDNLQTYGTGDDIYVDTSATGQVTIRWNATNEADGSDVNSPSHSSTPERSGSTTAPGNTNLTPTVGISRGDGRFDVPSTYNGRNTLTNVNSVQFELTPGITCVDIGAYEFRGNSNDSTPPQVIATAPAVIDASGTTGSRITQIQVGFSEELDSIDANATAAYELRRAVNGIFDDSDDVVYTLTPNYLYDPVAGSSVTTLDLGLAGASLPGGTYRLTLRGNATSSVHDTAGNRLDGDSDGVPGPNYVRTFVIRSPGITITPISGLVTTEAGGQASFTVVLDAEPTQDVTIGIASSNATEGTVSPVALSFTAANWNTPQLVTVTGVDDAIDDGDVSFTIVTAAATSSDVRYDGLNAADIAVTNTDDDTAGITVSAISGNTSEVGGTATLSVVLDSEPIADVTVI